MTENLLNKAVFLDRDGTINEDSGYPASLADIILFPMAIKVLRYLKKSAYKIIIVTNQSGVARGYFNEAAVQDIHNGMQQLFARHNVRIDDFYYCPHHPQAAIEKYRQQCDCRKPNSGMFLKAAQEHQIDFQKSFMVGDKYSDIEAGNRLDMKTILALTGEGEKQYHEKKDTNISQPDFVVANIGNIIDIIK